MGHCNENPVLTEIVHCHQYTGTRRLMHRCTVTAQRGQRALGKTVKAYLGTFWSQPSSKVILCWKDEADRHCNQSITGRRWLSLSRISPSQSSRSLTPYYTHTDASARKTSLLVHASLLTLSAGCSSREVSWGHTQKNTCRRECSAVSPFLSQVHSLQYPPS